MKVRLLLRRHVVEALHAALHDAKCLGVTMVVPVCSERATDRRAQVVLF